MGGVFYRLSYD